MRESVRTMDYRLKPGYDIILVARNSINGHKCQDVQKTLLKTLRSCNLVENRSDKQ